MKSDVQTGSICIYLLLECGTEAFLSNRKRTCRITPAKHGGAHLYFQHWGGIDKWVCEFRSTQQSYIGQSYTVRLYLKNIITTTSITFKGRLLGVEYSAEHFSINLVSIKIMIFWELERWLSD